MKSADALLAQGQATEQELMRCLVGLRAGPV